MPVSGKCACPVMSERAAVYLATSRYANWPLIVFSVIFFWAPCVPVLAVWTRHVVPKVKSGAYRNFQRYNTPEKLICDLILVPLRLLASVLLLTILVSSKTLALADVRAYFFKLQGFSFSGERALRIADP
jgi:hypothetical protein